MYGGEGERFVAAASAFIGLAASGPGEAMARGGIFADGGGEGTGEPRNWDVAVVSQVGYWALFDHSQRRSAWPLLHAPPVIATVVQPLPEGRMSAHRIAIDGALTPDQRIVESNLAFDSALPVHSRFIRQKARELADGNTMLQEEMIQVGQIALWELDPSRLTAADEGFTRMRIASRMLDLLRHEESVIGGATRVDIDEWEGW